MKETLILPADKDGRVWRHTACAIARHPHHHTEVELNLVTAGTARYLVGDKRYDLRPQTLVWLFPEQDHVLLDESPGYAMWIGVFKPDLVRRACNAPQSRPLRAGDPSGHFCRLLPDGVARRLDSLLGEVDAAGDDTDRYNAGLAYVLLSSWAAYAQAEAGTAGAGVHPAVEHAVRLLRDEAEPLTLEEIGRRAGLSPSRLSRLFRRQTGVSLADFRNRQRLERFLHLYGQDRRLSLLAAALEAGFGSYPQFHRVFKAQMGVSPAEYRRGQRGAQPLPHGKHAAEKGITAADDEQGGTNV